MADEKEGTTQVEPVVTPTTNVEQVVKEPEKTTFTLEDVKRLIAEDGEVRFKGLQRVIAKKDSEIKTLKETPTNADTNVDVTTLRKILNTVKASGGDEATIKEAEEALSQAERKVKMASQLTYQQRIINENQTKFNDLIEKAGLDLEDSILNNYELAFEMAKQTGDFSVPERILNKTLKGVKPVADVKAEVKVEPKVDVEAEVQKRLNAELVKRGLLKTDTGAVTGINPSKPKLDELLKADTRKMTYKQLEEHKAAIKAASKT